MPIGKKNRKLLLQQPDGAGGYTDVEEVFGSRRFLTPTGPETLRAGAAIAAAQWQFVITYRSDVRAEWRVLDVDESRTFQISAYGETDDRLIDMQLLGTEIQ